MTDRWTDTAQRHRPHLCIASCAKTVGTNHNMQLALHHYSITIHYYEQTSNQPLIQSWMDAVLSVIQSFGIVSGTLESTNIDKWTMMMLHHCRSWVQFKLCTRCTACMTKISIISLRRCTDCSKSNYTLRSSTIWHYGLCHSGHIQSLVSGPSRMQVPLPGTAFQSTCGILSICLSVTFRYKMKMVQHIVIVFSPYGNPIILVLSASNNFTKF